MADLPVVIGEQCFILGICSPSKSRARKFIWARSGWGLPKNDVPTSLRASASPAWCAGSKLSGQVLASGHTERRYWYW